ncbi:YdcF family protein [Stappia sp. F7233]|uniref:YdcF family protein n=1 Tax=Stappia albiluteola TaxID=2758565 RepID=A0A839AFU8_9HYPH|nr:YdcF family protein [Stappia albiluteola]MBA5778593.1 YdcF family protein [Stappia albiluteola]
MADQNATTAPMEAADPAERAAGGDCVIARPSPGRKRPRKRVILPVLASTLAAFLLIANFLHFANSVVGARLPDSVFSDAIVVLTGGSDRISQALGLLKEGQARRLLISGVHPATTPEQIVRSTAADPDLFACCVDLDRKALNTTENAAETAKWAQEKGFSSLLVVTSAYHMPRSLLELQTAMPSAKLIPYPVVRENLDMGHWYLDPATTQLLLREYVKYTVAWLRTGAKVQGSAAAATAQVSD